MGQHNINLDFETEKIQREYFKGSQNFSKWVSEQINKLKNDNLTTEEISNKIKEIENHIIQENKEIEELKNCLERTKIKEIEDEENKKEFYIEAMRCVHEAYNNSGRESEQFKKTVSYWSERLKIDKTQLIKDVLGD